MLTKSLPEKLLRYMYKRHIALCGYGVRNLEKSKLLVTSGPGIEKEIPEILIEQTGVFNGTPFQVKKYLTVDAALELKARGDVQFSKDGGEFWLTEAGYRRAEQGWIQRFIGYLNKNPGISIPIALISLIISIISTIIALIALLTKSK